MIGEPKTPRLGSASLDISINDRDGFTVCHGTDGTLLASKPPEQCTDEWSRLWRLLEEMGVKRNLQPEPNED